MDRRGFIQRICADEAAQVYIVDADARRDRVHRWSSAKAAREQVHAEIYAGRSATGG